MAQTFMDYVFDKDNPSNNKDNPPNVKKFSIHYNKTGKMFKNLLID